MGIRFDYDYETSVLSWIRMNGWTRMVLVYIANWKSRTHAEQCTLFYLQFKITLLLHELTLNAADFTASRLGSKDLQASNKCKYIHHIYEYAMKYFEASHRFALRTNSEFHVAMYRSFDRLFGKGISFDWMNKLMENVCVCWRVLLLPRWLCAVANTRLTGFLFFFFIFRFENVRVLHPNIQKSIRITWSFMSTTRIVTVRLRQSQLPFASMMLRRTCLKYNLCQYLEIHWNFNSVDCY